MVENRPNIAVVDDDEGIRKSLRRLLSSAGCDVETFASAEHFMSALLDRTFVCLILDVRLPGQNGIEFHQHLVDDKHNIPTVFISAHEDELSRAQRVTSYVVDYLHKPFDPEELLRVVQRAAADSGTSHDKSLNRP